VIRAARPIPRPRELPQFIEPMLAAAGDPFDSDEFLFEIKWDGTRALAFIDRGEVRLMNRRRIDMTARYPELAFMGSLPAGTVLDGEIVALKRGKPDFGALQRREHAGSRLRVRMLSGSMPATFMAFDLLYQRHRPILDEPLSLRRQRLRELIEHRPHSLLVFSDGVIGAGRDYFAAACQRGLEGVMAKRLDSRYTPGRRSGAWVKIKQCHTLLCAVIGFLPDGENDFRSLLLATDEGGKAVYVGRVSSGIDQGTHEQLKAMLFANVIPRPVVDCHVKARWVEPVVYCTIRYLERTASGQLRAPVFVEVCDAA